MISNAAGAEPKIPKLYSFFYRWFVDATNPDDEPSRAIRTTDKKEQKNEKMQTMKKRERVNRKKTLDKGSENELLFIS